MIPFEKFQTLLTAHAFHFDFSLRCSDELLWFVQNYLSPISLAVLVPTIVVLVDFQCLHVGRAVVIVQYHDVVRIASFVLRLGVLEGVLIGFLQFIFSLEYLDGRKLQRICRY